MIRKTIQLSVIAISIIAGIIACGQTAESNIPVTPVITSPANQVPAPVAVRDVPAFNARCQIMNMGADLPEFGITIKNPSDVEVPVGTLTIIGYMSSQETGSTEVDVNQAIAAGQDMTFWSNLPAGWWTENQATNPSTFSAIPTSCQALSNGVGS